MSPAQKTIVLFFGSLAALLGGCVMLWYFMGGPGILFSLAFFSFGMLMLREPGEKALKVILEKYFRRRTLVLRDAKVTVREVLEAPVPYSLREEYEMQREEEKILQGEEPSPAAAKKKRRKFRRRPRPLHRFLTVDMEINPVVDSIDGLPALWDALEMRFAKYEQPPADPEEEMHPEEEGAEIVGWEVWHDQGFRVETSPEMKGSRRILYYLHLHGPEVRKIQPRYLYEDLCEPIAVPALPEAPLTALFHHGPRKDTTHRDKPAISKNAPAQIAPVAAKKDSPETTPPSKADEVKQIAPPVVIAKDEPVKSTVENKPAEAVIAKDEGKLPPVKIPAQIAPALKPAQAPEPDKIEQIAQPVRIPKDKPAQIAPDKTDKDSDKPLPVKAPDITPALDKDKPSEPPAQIAPRVPFKEKMAEQFVKLKERLGILKKQTVEKTMQTAAVTQVKYREAQTRYHSFTRELETKVKGFSDKLNEKNRLPLEERKITIPSVKIAALTPSSTTKEDQTKKKTVRIDPAQEMILQSEVTHPKKTPAQKESATLSTPEINEETDSAEEYAGFHYFIMREGEMQEGPFEYDEVQDMFEKGELRSEHLIWYPGLPDWTPISEIEEIVEEE